MDRVSESRTGRKTETRYSAQNGNGAGVVNRRAKQRALAIGVIDGREHGEPLAELKELLRTAGVETVGIATQQRPKPDPDRYFGRGRLEELKAEIAAADANVVACDDELLPRQERNLETALGVPVVDRTAVILDIFADHAHSAEGKLQVELAQLEYNMARMRGLWTHLERLGGGIGTRGPGESQIETDRRLARDRIAALRRRLRQTEKNRGVMRAQRERSHIPSVALAGYTNAGKSTLLNALTGAEVGVANRLFETLDPTTRNFELSGRDYLLTDTVGFIEKLPHQLVEAFKATLEETTLADLIVHVVDASETEERRMLDMHAVDEVLEEIGAGEKPRLLVLNKADLLSDDERREVELAHQDAVLVSALAGEGLDDLRERIERVLRRDPDRGRAADPLQPGRPPARAARGGGRAGADRRPRRRPRPRPRPLGGDAPLRRPRGRLSRLESRRASRLRAMDLPVIKLKDNAVMPTRAHPGDAGLDLYSTEAAHLGPGERWWVGTGIAVEIPEGHAGLVLPRSGPRPRARDRPGQQPRADRRGLPRRSAGAAAEHRSGRDGADRGRRPDRPAGGDAGRDRRAGRGDRALRLRPRRRRLRLDRPLRVRRRRRRRGGGSPPRARSPRGRPRASPRRPSPANPRGRGGRLRSGSCRRR